MMPCQRCKADNRPGRLFCGACGAPLPAPCACGFLNDPGDRFCGGCGRPITAAVTPPDSPREAVETHPSPPVERAVAQESERRQVTVLFADMKGYTPLAESLGEEGAYALMDRVYASMIEVVDRHGGTVQDLTGDGVLALFGAPQALEDAPLRACRAAIEMQRRLIEVGADLEAQPGVRVQARVGINTGPVVLGSVGTDVRAETKAVGDTVNVAARLESMAEPGTVLMSETTHRLVADDVESDDLGEREMKGKSSPQRVWRLTGVRGDEVRFARVVRRGLRRFVGRDDELERLAQSFEDACDQGPRVVDVVGEAGIGKSRLAFEFRRRLDGRDVCFLEAHGSADGGASSFLPCVALVRQILALPDGAPADLAATIARGLGALGLRETSAPYLANLFGIAMPELDGLDGEIIGLRTRETLAALVRERCRRSPVLLVVDDLHWIDRASETVFADLVATPSQPGLMIVCTYRPDHRPPWARDARVIELRLTALSADSVTDVARQVLGGRDAAPALVQRVLDAAGGNPLFAEEMSRYLLETGGHGPRDGDADGVTVPDSLQDVIRARVDRLPEGHRRVLQVAAVVGRRFRLDLVSAVTGLDDLTLLLGDLEDQDIVQRAGDEAGFRHALVREAVYASLLTGRRAELHQRIGEAMERLHPSRLGEWVDVLAHHFAQTPVVAKTIHYLARAGDKSLRVYALDEADMRFRRALELADRTPGTVGDDLLGEILLGWVRVHYYRKDFRRIIELIGGRVAAIDALGASRRRALSLFWLGFAHAMACGYEVAGPLLDEALALGETLGDEECIGYASMGLVYRHWGQGGLAGRARVEMHGERALEIAGRRNDVYLAGKSLFGLAMDAMFRGRPASARVFCRRLTDLGRRAGDPRTLALGLAAEAHLTGFEERFEEAVARADEAVRLSPDPLDRLNALTAKCWALVLAGRVKDGLALLEDVRREVQAGDFQCLLLATEYAHGLALLMDGRMAGGMRAIEEWMQRFDAWGFEAWAALGHGILGEVYLRMALGTEKVSFTTLMRNIGFVVTSAPRARRRCRAHLEACAAAARKVDAPAILARALASLAELATSGGQADEAQALLAEARGLAAALDSPVLARKIRTG